MAARGYEFYLRVSEANEWEILSAREDKIRIPKILMKFPHKTPLFLFIFETAKIVTYRKMSLIAISSHVKDKNSMFTARGEDMIFS